MKSSKSPVTSAPQCGLPGCTKPAPLKCSRCKEVRYCSKEHQKSHWKLHKKLCVPPGERIAAPGSIAAQAASIPVKSVEEEDKCIICLDNTVSTKLKPCQHSVCCKACVEELFRRRQPCPLCRKQISGWEVGKFVGSLGAHGLWPTSLKNLMQLGSGEGFNEYFQDLFVGNEASYLKWKEVFDVLEIVGVGEEGGGESLEQQVLKITGSEDMEKLRALEKLCSPEFFDDVSLLVVVSRRVLEVLELKMEKKGKVQGKKKKKKADPGKVEVFLDACLALGRACSFGVDADFDDVIRYVKQAKEGYEEQLGADSEKTLEATKCLICVTRMSDEDRIDKLKAVVDRMVRALGEESIVTLDALNDLGKDLMGNGEYEEARKVFERCLAGREKVLGKDRKEMWGTVHNLGLVYHNGLNDYEKALKYYERALKGFEKTLGKTHPETLETVQCCAIVYAMKRDFQNAAENFRKVVDGNVAQLGKDHESTKRSVRNLAGVYLEARESEKLSELKKEFPWMLSWMPRYA
jgi:tetratricopeptide (TPR) repeat protein